jgi:hypothetical protein
MHLNKSRTIITQEWRDRHAGFQYMASSYFLFYIIPPVQSVGSENEEEFSFKVM